MTSLLPGYAAFLGPKQDFAFDMSILKRLVGLEGLVEFLSVNPVVLSMFNILGVYPAIFAALLVPAGRSATKVG